MGVPEFLKELLPSRRLGISAAGLVGTVLLHLLIVLSFVLDLSLPARHLPTKSGAGPSALASDQELEMTVVFINELSPTQSAPRPEPLELASRGVAPPDLRVVVLSPDPSPPAAAAAHGEESQDNAPPLEADPTQHAILYGRYVGQVQARIERAWMRPRTEIGAPQFSCRARIEQGRRGDVFRVDLDHCKGSQRWQQSLVSAIRTASPLPAPPDVSVYADILWLSFVSEGFKSGGSAQGFEPERSQTGFVHDSEIARQSFEQFASGARRMFRPDDKEDSKVVHLTIVGSPAPETSLRNELPPVPLPPPSFQSPATAPPPQ
jgi:hypothetical protein